MASLRFREDIEGLRGVAILLVVLAHAGVPGLSAGFIGVDVFFVISGFLITGLLTEELRATGRVDFWSFYARRARRLAPALLLMILLVGAAAILWLPRGEALPQITTAIWALLWASNLHFALGGIEYFGADIGTNLFLHTWSLGVEEQFYLLWPWIIVLAWRAGGRSALWLGCLVAGGFLLCQLLLAWDPRATFYLMPARLWQLALGGLAYQLAGRAAGKAALPTAWLGLPGALLIAAGLVVIRPGDAHPGWLSLLPSVGAGALLLAGAGAGARTTGWLSLAPLRLVGRVSYSWYLWHWPFLVWLPASGLTAMSPLMALALVLASFLVAWASLTWVEQPFRRPGARPSQEVVAVAVLASVLLAIALHLGQSWRGELSKSAMDQLERAVYLQLSMPEIYGRNCDDWFHSADLNPCQVGEHDGSAGSIVLIADSVGAQWVPAVEHAAREQRRTLIVLTKSSCPIMDLPFFYARINRRFTECEEWRAKAIDYVAQTRPALVIIGSTQYTFAREELEAGTERILRALSSPGRSLVVLAPTPILPFDAPRCVLSTGYVRGDVVEAPRCSAPLAEHDPSEQVEALRDAAGRVERASVLDLGDLACPGQTCRALVDGRLIYRDNQHLNAGYAEALGAEFDRRLRAALDRTTLPQASPPAAHDPLPRDPS